MDLQSRYKILLLDDDRFVRFTIPVYLKSEGMEVDTAGTIDEALEMVRHVDYDALVIDILLGRNDGFAFRDALRAFRADTPAIFISSCFTSFDDRIAHKVLEDSASYFVPKSSWHEYLVNRIRQAVRSYRAKKVFDSYKAANKRELEIAARVQHALMPSWCMYSGNFFYTCYWKPFSTVSGDVCICLPVSENCVLGVIGDISGHGTPAAMAMAVVQSHLRSVLSSGEVEAHMPNLICAEIDSFIRANLTDIAYMTGVVLHLDNENGILRYFNAGAPDVLCFSRTDGSKLDLNPRKLGGRPMGLFTDSEYPEDQVVECRLPADAVLCLHSDGLTDVSSDAEGENRLPPELLHEIIGELVKNVNGTTDLGSLPFRLADNLKLLGYRHEQDDMTFAVAARVMANGARYVATVSLKTAAELDDAVRKAGEWVEARGLGGDLRGRVELLLGEHFENVRKHGMDEYLRQRGVMPFEMRACGDEIEIMAWDRGNSFKSALAIFPENPAEMLISKAASMTTSGRGLAIIKTISPLISYESFAGLNKFTFHVPYDASRAAGRGMR